jgi:hypothetical protein
MMKPELNRQLIDQLVCGDLQGTEYRRAILALEADPQKWRDCALAFLQEQAITQELKQLASGGQHWSQASSANLATTQPLSPEPNSSGPNWSQPKWSEQGAPLADKRSWIYKAGSLAAIMMLSFTIGWLSSNSGASTTANSQPPENGLVSQNQGTAPDLQLDNMSVQKMLPDTRMVSNNGLGNGNSPWSLLPIDQQIPANLARLEKEGQIKIQSNMALMPLDHDGVMMFVPVQQIRVVPTTFTY